MLCADTNFLFSLYGHDAHTGEALARLKKSGQPLLLSALNEFELGNAFRFAESRGLLPAGSAAQRLAALAEDHAAGRWRLSEIPLLEIVAEAGRLSALHTVSGGHRSFDILHVAHAR
ncbi:MAG: PIN domain-containing protein, partial [Verrucomicrobiota bacterium]|nr:PIN domain-containing protein [Verrucomicrobiota bacterium]